MRSSIARRAQQASERFLTPYNPTGLAGLLTHPQPRPALISIYRETLEHLSKLPKGSAYRTSAEAITKHRLNIIETTKPEGYEAWAKKASEQLKQSQENPQIGLRKQAEEQYWDDREVEWDNTGLDAETSRATDTREITFAGRNTAAWRESQEKLAALKAKEGELYAQELEPEELTEQLRALNKEIGALEQQIGEVQILDVEDEPALTAQQVNELETKFGAGLIEEVIQVAEGELKLVQVMQENQVWEELVEKVPEGQWSYFERVSHVKGTQKP